MERWQLIDISTRKRKWNRKEKQFNITTKKGKCNRKRSNQNYNKKRKTRIGKETINWHYKKKGKVNQEMYQLNEIIRKRKWKRKGNNESKLQRERESEIGTVTINRCNNNWSTICINQILWSRWEKWYQRQSATLHHKLCINLVSEESKESLWFD